MEYNFHKFNSSDFEHLVQALAQKLLGNTSIIFGKGPDGGRELTFDGQACFPNNHQMWKGHWVIQAKFKERDFTRKESYTWIANNLEKELRRFKNNKGRIPDNYLFFTNAILSPAPARGGRDKIETLKEEYCKIIPNILILAYDELCRYIDNNKDVRIAYGLETMGDLIDGKKTQLSGKTGRTYLAGDEIREQTSFAQPLRKVQEKRFLAIDFGTSYSIASIINEDGNVELIKSPSGKVLVPSIVTFLKDGGYIVGNPKYLDTTSKDYITILNIKRDLGTDKIYKVFDERYSPESIASFIIKSLKTNAEEYLGYEIDKILISKPANFNTDQTSSLIKAFRLAGLKIKRIIDEPTSACLVFPQIHFLEGSPIELKSSHRYICIDLGGGTFDVAVVEYCDGLFEIKSVMGDNSLGGIDYDYKISKYLHEQITKKIPFIDDYMKPKLLYEAERVKKDLGTRDSTTVILSDIESQCGNIEYVRIEISRTQFISLTQELNERIYNCIERILMKTGHWSRLEKKIQAVLLTGQGGKIFTVRHIIQQLFPDVPIIDKFAENAVSIGVASYCGVMQGDIKEQLLLNVHNRRIAIRALSNEKDHKFISSNSNKNNEYITLLEADTRIPIKNTMKIAIENGDNKAKIAIEVYEFSNVDEKRYYLGKAEIRITDKHHMFKFEINIEANSTILLRITNLDLNEKSTYLLNNFHLLSRSQKEIKNIAYLNRD